MEAVIGTVGNLFGASEQADAASSAAATSAAAADRATNLQKQMFDKQIEMQEPFRQGGISAQNRLMYLLGLQPALPTRDQLRQNYLSQYTSQVPTQVSSNAVDAMGVPISAYQTQNQSVVDEQGLNNAINAELARLQAGQAAAPQDREFGSLARNFSMQDFQQDPGYAFRLNEGLKSLDRQAAARGGLISGAALKASQRYGQEMASQEYQNAFNRYQAERAAKLNPLQSLAGVGQSSANTLGQAGANYATAAGNLGMSSAYDQGNAAMSGAAGRSSAYQGIGNTLGRYLNTPNALSGMGGTSSISNNFGPSPYDTEYY